MLPAGDQQAALSVHYMKDLNKFNEILHLTWITQCNASTEEGYIKRNRAALVIQTYLDSVTFPTALDVTTKSRVRFPIYLIVVHTVAVDEFYVL